MCFLFFVVVVGFCAKASSVPLSTKERKWVFVFGGFYFILFGNKDLWQQRVIQTLFPRSPNPSRVGKEERQYLIRTEKKRKKTRVCGKLQ